MDIVRLTYPFDTDPAPPHPAMAIGFFDGVHPGHRQVIKRAGDMAYERRLVSSVLTFEPHPREVLLNQKLRYITPLNEKLAQFADCGVQRTYILTFDRALSLLTPEQFVNGVLVPLNAAAVVVGFNFTYGHLGRGNVEMLREIAGDRMRVSVVRPIHVGGMKVSSTIIREKLLNGEVELAGDLLGRLYSFNGVVVEGHGRGRTIGIPTANLQPTERFLIPKVGVYAVYATVDGKRCGGVMNIGYKPTFGDGEDAPSLEAHLLDFDRNIYGRQVKVEFAARLRGERKFDSAGQLVEQIREDIGKAQTILA